MSIRVVDTYASDELPDDLWGATWALATRRVRRLLNDVSIPPYIVSVELFTRLGAVDPSRVALFTVSGWDSSDNPRDVSTTVEAGPSDWLRQLCNVSLCQSAITAGVTGPNAHLVGGGEAFCHGLALASAVLEQGAATHALVVAFDVPRGDGACSRAAGLTLSFDSSTESGRSRLDVLDSFIPFESALVLADSCVAAVRAASRSDVLVENGAVRVG